MNIDNSKNELNLNLDDLEKKYLLKCAKCRTNLKKNDVKQIISYKSSNEKWSCVICKTCINNQKTDTKNILMNQRLKKWLTEFYETFKGEIYK